MALTWPVTTPFGLGGLLRLGRPSTEGRCWFRVPGGRRSRQGLTRPLRRRDRFLAPRTRYVGVVTPRSWVVTHYFLTRVRGGPDRSSHEAPLRRRAPPLPDPRLAARHPLGMRPAVVVDTAVRGRIHEDHCDNAGSRKVIGGKLAKLSRQIANLPPVHQPVPTNGRPDSHLAASVRRASYDGRATATTSPTTSAEQRGLERLVSAHRTPSTRRSGWIDHRRRRSADGGRCADSARRRNVGPAATVWPE